MVTANSDGNLVAGGRVTLNRQVLINLRREKGLSQELLALMCAEQRLCVSIASVKRAETGKNILYRTARDISLFFEVDLPEIVANDPSPTAQKDPGIEQPKATFISATREIVVLVVNFASLRAINLTGMNQYWTSACKLAAGRYDGEYRPLGEARAAFLFGSISLMGYEHFQALHCIRWLQGQMHSLLTNDATLLSRIIYLELAQGDDDPKIDDAGVIEMLGDIGLDGADHFNFECDLILADESAKQGLESRYRLTLFEPDEIQNDKSFWLVHEGQQYASEVKSFIGRDLQCQQFKAAIESVYAYNEMQVIYVRGMAGIGKTRLLEEFCDHASSLGIEFHKAHVLDFGAERNQLAIPRLIRSILGLGDDEINLSLEALNTRFGREVCDAPDLVFLYSWLNWPLIGKDLSLFNAMNHETRIAGLQGVVENLIRKATLKSPLLLCLEDMHWASDDLLDSIQQLAEALKDNQVILLLTSRQENDPLQNKWASAWVDSPMLVMNLSPLRDSEANKFADYFEDASSDYKLQCIERAEGNPLFLEQLLRAPNHQQERLPHTVQTLVLSRLDSLSQQSQTVARAASVLGQWFTEDALNHVLDSEQLPMRPLLENYLIKRSNNRFQFVHALVHQGVYQTITEGARIDLHQRCAQWFEPFDIALQARHLNRAKADSAAGVYLQATQIKIREHNFDEALLLIDEALEIEYTTVDESKLWLLKGEAVMAKGNTDQAIECYQQAINTATTDQHKFAPLIGLANGLDTLERFDDALNALSQAESCVSVSYLNSELSRIHYLRGNFYFPKGEVDACREEHEKALDYARRAKDSHAEAEALGGLGDAAYAQGKMMTALNYFGQCLKLCSANDFSKVEAANRFMLATTRIYHNDIQQALVDALGSVDLAIAVGHKRAEIVSRLTAGWILLDMQELAPAAMQIERGLELAKDIGARRFEPFLGESLARYHDFRGDKGAATAILAEAYEQIHQQGIEEFIGPWIISSYALILGDCKQAQELLAEGSALLQRHCIGHNYFRFYVNAMESALLRKDTVELQQYMNALATYTSEEPTPWSEYYLKRARLLSDTWSAQPADGLVEQMLELKAEGERVGLLPSLDLICDAIDGLQVNPPA